MVLKFDDFVSETSQTAGTGTIDLDGAKSGFQSFVAGIGDTNTCFYVISNDSDREVGLGTVTDAAPDTLSRDTILSSTNAGSAVDWTAGGTQDVSCIAPALAVASFNQSKGPTAPANPQAGMLWLEDDTPSSTRWTLQQYDGTDWIKIGEIDSTLNKFSVFGAWTLIENITLSNDAVADFITGIGSTYDHYMIKLKNVLLANETPTSLDLRVSTNGGSSFVETSTYDRNIILQKGATGGVASNNANASTTAMRFCSDLGNASHKGYSGEVHFSNPGLALHSAFYFFGNMTTAGGVRQSVSGMGFYNSTGIVNALRVLASDGNLVSGELTLYGLSKG